MSYNIDSPNVRDWPPIIEPPPDGWPRSLRLESVCSGQLIPDSDLSFSSLATGGNPSFAACGLF